MQLCTLVEDGKVSDQLKEIGQNIVKVLKFWKNVMEIELAPVK